MQQTTKKGYTLTALPLSILTRILRYVCSHNPFDRTNRLAATFWLPFRDPRVTYSLLAAESLNVPLPCELLPPALASPVLAAAVANILGDRVSFLTHCNTGGHLAAWIKAFAPYVKAVRPEDIPPVWLLEKQDSGTRQVWAPIFHTQLVQRRKHSVHLFKTLLAHSVMLEVLDLQDVDFLNLTILQDELVAGLCATLESNSGTLRELGLPAFRTSDISDKALQISQLKKLDVLAVKVWAAHVVKDSEPLPPPIVRMIRAVDGHADKSRRMTTLRELRLSQVGVGDLGYDHLTASDKKSSVFLAVKTLRTIILSTGYYSDDYARFICLFKNLERLFWNVSPDSSDRLFEKICTKVREIHMGDSRWISKPIQVGAEEHHDMECNFFGERSYERNYGSGAITTFFADAMSGIDVRTMMMYCPRLQNLSVHITRDNIRAIRKLITKCQQMKCLELIYGNRKHNRLKAKDWYSVSRIIPQSHRNLCQVAIQNKDMNSWDTGALEAVFECFERVTKALGDRARRLAFRARFRTTEGAKIMERICRLLNVCMQHTPSLESLQIEPRATKGDRSDYERGWGKRLARRLIETENRMVQEVPSLRMLDIGVMPWLLEGIEWNGESLETDSMSSKAE